MKHFVCGILFPAFRLPHVAQWLRRLSVRRCALPLLTLIVVFLGSTQVLLGECGCVTCRQHAGANWFCAPQPTTASVEVTEWGVQSDMICPKHSGLFGSACQCPSACSNNHSLAGGPCDAACTATCDASGVDGLAGLAGLDPDVPLSCDCAPGDGFLGLCKHSCFRLPGIGPRARQRLMRKTLVYPTSTQEFVAIPCAPDSHHLMVHPPGIGLEPIGETESELPPLDVYPPDSAHTLISLPPAPVTMLLSETVKTPAPVITAASYSLSSSSGRVPNVAWIGRSDVEEVECSDTMESASGFQPPAPVLPARWAASTDAWPERSPSHLPNPR